MEELISIIVPIYDVEKFLDKCINSIANQTYKNLEIILIDDGSTDESVQICDKWKEKDNRIKVIHKKNEGVSIARNIGVKMATGKYISFVDSDDYIDLDMIEILYNNLIENNTDIAMCGHIAESFSDQLVLYCKNNFVADSEETLRKLFTRDDVFTVLWGKLYKKELFDGLKFPEGEVHEDLAIVYQLFDRAKKTSHLDKASYHYVQRHGSIMHKDFQKERVIAIEFLEEALKLSIKKYPRLVEDAEIFLIRQLYRYIALCKENKLEEERKRLKKKLKEYFPRIFKNSKMNWQFKLKGLYVYVFK